MGVYQAAMESRRNESQSSAGTRVPVIALIAYALAEDKAKCLGAGMDGWVPGHMCIKLEEPTAVANVLQPKIEPESHSVRLILSSSFRISILTTRTILSLLLN